MAKQSECEYFDEITCRILLGLSECDCGEGIWCPEITMNMLGHYNEEVVVAILEKHGFCYEQFLQETNNGLAEN